MRQSMSAKLPLWLGVVIIKATWLRASLLYPANSVLQLTASLSVPVIDLPPQRRIAFDWGFQMNYNMPSNVSSFYNVPIWPRRQHSTKKRDVDLQLAQKHHLDVDLMDFYQYLEQSLESYGFHKTCLLLCICELAQKAFECTDLNFLIEIFRFLTSPTSIFDYSINNQTNKISAYILAQMRGGQKEKCVNFYSLCNQSPLGFIVKIVND